MKTKTVRLHDFFSVHNGVVEKYTPGEWRYESDGTPVQAPPTWEPVYAVGNEVVLVRIDNLRTGSVEYEIRTAPNGIGGNMNRHIRQFHGWRGTTNDIHMTAIGRRKIKKISTLKNGTVAVTVGPDLDPEEA